MKEQNLEHKTKNIKLNSQNSFGKAFQLVRFTGKNHNSTTLSGIQKMADNYVKKINYPFQKKTNGVVQRVTNIKYDTTAFDLEHDDKKEIVGKKMEATLDPTDKIHGSAPGSGVQTELMEDLKAKGYKRMVRGHLLNGQLGGLGIAANLFPITTQANAKHKNHVENPVKDQITDGKEIKYTVEVIAANKLSNPNAQFVCNAKATDNSWSRSETIDSAPAKTATRGSNIEGSAALGTSSMSFRSGDLPKGWGEKGSGYDQSTDHKKTAGKYKITFNGETKDVDNSIYAKGLHFNSGLIDRQEYANELIGKYNGDPDNKWPIYFFNKPYTSQELEDFIDTAGEDTVEAIIKKLESLL